jgi:hypothetical protein
MAPDVVRMAEVAATVHDAGPGRFAHAYFRWFADLPFDAPPAAGRPQLWERALDVLGTMAMPSYPNVLWFRGRCSGVVDWAEACRGPAGYDVADRFRRAYETLTGERQDPYWELVSVFEHGPAPWTAAEVAETEPRLALAIEAITS